MSTATPADAQVADTLGWDSVFAVKISEVNKAIASKKNYPPALTYKHEPQKGDFPPVLTQLDADFGVWQIVEGGDGAIIRFRLPMSNIRGKCINQGNPVDFKIEDFDLFVKIKLTAKLMDAETKNAMAAAGAAPATAPPKDDMKPIGTKMLVARTETSNPKEDPVAVVEQISADKIKITPGDLATLRYGLEGILSDWCNANLGDFKHIFSMVDIYDKADTGQWSFLKPRELSYAYIEPATHPAPENSLLACLCMTSADKPPAQQQLSPFAVPANCQAGFLLSSKRMFTDLMLPNFPKAWDKAKVEDFEVMSDGLGIQLKAGKEVELESFDKNGTSYTPVLKNLTIRLEVDELRTDAYVETEISPGIIGTNQSIHRHTMYLGPGKNGQQTILLKEKEPPVDNQGIKNAEEIDDADQWLMVLGGIAGLILIALAPATGGLTLLIAGVVIFLVFGLMPLTVAIIDDVFQDETPSADSLVLMASSPITWTDAKDFKLTTAGLNGSFQMGGSIS